MRKIYIVFALLTMFTMLNAEIIHIFGEVSLNINEQLTPIEGATIEVDNVIGNVVTNNEGQYQIDVNWIWNGPIYINCNKEGYNSLTQSILPRDTDTQINFELEISEIVRTIHGRVHYIDAQNYYNPIEGASVGIQGTDYHAETDANGNYNIDYYWDWDDSISLTCSKSGYNQVIQNVIPINLSEEINFQMIQNYIVHSHVLYGTVLNSDSGIPVNNAEIEIVNCGNNTISNLNGDYELSYDWSWDGPVIVYCTHEEYQTQIVSFYPESNTSEINFTLSTEESPSSITIQGYITQAYPNNDIPIAGAVISFGAPGEAPVKAEISLNTGFYSCSLIRYWDGPININCHYPGYYHVFMDYTPNSDMNDLNFFMQPLPPIFTPPRNLIAEIINGEYAHLVWEAPSNWPLEGQVNYRIYIKENDNLSFHPLATTHDTSYNYEFTISESGEWMAEFALTAFQDSTETDFSNFVTIGHSTSVNNNTQLITNTQLSVYPNPFNPSTNIYLELTKNYTVKAEIFNVRGQLVKELYKGILKKGSNTLTWKGIDNDGKNVSSGIYLLKIQTDNNHIYSRKLSLIK